MEINGKDIAVEQHGDGDAVVMVHGLGGTSNTWYPQVGPLARFFRVVRPRSRGLRPLARHGRPLHRLLRRGRGRGDG